MHLSIKRKCRGLLNVVIWYNLEWTEWTEIIISYIQPHSEMKKYNNLSHSRIALLLVFCNTVSVLVSLRL